MLLFGFFLCPLFRTSWNNFVRPFVLPSAPKIKTIIYSPVGSPNGPEGSPYSLNGPESPNPPESPVSPDQTRPDHVVFNLADLNLEIALLLVFVGAFWYPLVFFGSV